MESEIVIGERYTSLVGTMDGTDDLFNGQKESDVKFKPLTRKRIINTSDFYNQLTLNMNINSEVLPAGCKFYKKFENGNKVIVLEEQPGIRNITVESSMEATVEKLRMTGKLKEYGYENFLNENKPPYTFQLMFPFLIQIILLNDNNYFKGIKVFFRLNPITGLADHLYRAPLYNIPDSQFMCIGSVNSKETLIETIEGVQQAFWSNSYNQDYTTNIAAYQKHNAHQLQDYLSWMYHTKINPMFIYSTNWIKNKENLSEIINDFSKISSSNKNRSAYKYLRNMISIGTSNKNLESNIKNIIYSTVVGSDEISVGDEVLYDSKKFYVYSIVSHINEDKVIGVELEDEEGNIIIVKLEDFREKYKNPYAENPITEVIVGDKTVKVGDIVSLDINGYNLYKKIKSIRIAKDGAIEAFIGVDHYLLNNIDFNIFDLSNIKINDKPLIVGDTYNITKQRGVGFDCTLYKIKFNEVRVNNQSQINLIFKNNQDKIKINYVDIEKNKSIYNFINEDTPVRSPLVLNIFSNLMLNDVNKPFKFIKNVGVLIPNREPSWKYIPTKEKVNDILDYILNKDKSELNIEGFMININFKVGDPIVYANWNNPDDMLQVSFINDFEYDKSNHVLYVNSSTQDGNFHFHIPYIDISSGKINMGVIRKLYSICRGWEAGDKIKATAAGIAMFPKKDTNKIIGFIDDGATKYPMALCSNLCTLWMNDNTLDSFENIKPSSKKYDKLTINNFDTTKIKLQYGDPVYYNNKTFPYSIIILTKREYTKQSMGYTDFSDITGMNYERSITNSDIDMFNKQGILTPRFAMSKMNFDDDKKCFPNLLGGYLVSGNSNKIFRSDQFKEDF